MIKKCLRIVNKWRSRAQKEDKIENKIRKDVLSFGPILSPFR
jgi:hypothetical protein